VAIAKMQWGALVRIRNKPTPTAQAPALQG